MVPEVASYYVYLNGLVWTLLRADQAWDDNYVLNTDCYNQSFDYAREPSRDEIAVVVIAQWPFNVYLD